MTLPFLSFYAGGVAPGHNFDERFSVLSAHKIFLGFFEITVGVACVEGPVEMRFSQRFSDVLHRRTLMSENGWHKFL
jgi:hypothetical protein